MPIAKGTLICKSDPFAYCVTHACRETHCDFCLKKNHELRRCTGCSFMKYCGKTCQKSGWKVHKHECRNIKRILPEVKTLEDALILVSRIIYMFKFGKVENHVETIGEITRRFGDLESHSEDIKKDANHVKAMHDFERTLQKFLPSEDVSSFSDIIEIFGKCQINGETILDDEHRAVGIGIYLGPSIFNHSCKPNATISFDGFSASVYLIEDLPTLDYSKIFVWYISLIGTTEERQKKLKERYYFDCDCARCLDVNEDKILSSLNCSVLDCNGPAILENDEWKCTICGFVLEKERVEIALKWMGTFKNAWPDLWQCLDLNKVEDVETMCAILETASRIFHPLNIHCYRVRELIYYACVSLNMVPRSLTIAESLIPLNKRCGGNFYSPLGIMLLRMAKASYFLGDRLWAEGYLTEAFEILDVTRGVTDEALVPYREMMYNLRHPRRY